jgi:hypothetical protein
MNPELVHVLALLCATFTVGMIAIAFLGEDAALPMSAKRRARQLFLANLDPGQRWSWRLRRRAGIVAASGRRYTISPYGPFNVYTRDAAYCLAVDGRIPVYDKLLAQKLLIEADEARFLAGANVRSRRIRAGYAGAM